ncbi:MAG: YbaB/EbfC family nucleoid-associated protein [bacterium]|nr:YbaB/EbfC family nucleoid-associated protein [bacterium]
MLKDLGNMGQIMKLQKKMKGIQKSLKKMETDGESSDGSVKATVNGEFMLTDISIDESLIQSGDTKKLQKMVLSAVNTAVSNSKDLAAKEMSSLTGGMNIPGLDDLMK